MLTLFAAAAATTMQPLRLARSAEPTEYVLIESPGMYALAAADGSITLSSWNKRPCLSAPCTAPGGNGGPFTAMAQDVRAAMRTDGRTTQLLVLGFGGGVVSGDVLCGSRVQEGVGMAPRDVNVTAVEFNPDIIAAAQLSFYDVMFGPNDARCPGASRQITVLQGDAVRVPALEPTYEAFFDVIVSDFPPAYDTWDGVDLDFWKRLRAFARPGGTLVINTLFAWNNGGDGLAEFDEKGGLTPCSRLSVDKLAKRLRQARWRVAVREVARSNCVLTATAV